ncbi:MAG: ThuA domain-containing protein [Limisphaerales bacterium]
MQLTIVRSRRCFLTALLQIVFLAAFLQAADGPPGQSATIRVLLVTGGHDFERKQFFEMFQTNSDISVQTVEHTNMAAFLKVPETQSYDVLALYDMWQDMSDETKADFVELLKQGKGLVVLHNALCSYQDWPEYRRIIGGRYFTKKAIIDGVNWPPSSYQHGRHFVIHVVDQSHPITRGVRDFEIHDETYKGFEVTADVHPLLTTDDPESTKTIAWTKTYLSSRVFFLQSGHDHFAWDNPNYQRLLRQGIRWAAGWE